MNRITLKRPKTLWAKTLLIFLAGGLIICLLFSVVYFQIVRIMTEKTNDLFENTVYQVSERCRQETEQIEDLILGIAENQWIKNYISALQAGEDNYALAKVRVMREVLRERNLNMADNVYVYIDGYAPINCFYSDPVFEIPEKYQDDLQEYHLFSGKEIGWQIVSSDPYVLEAVTYIHDGSRVYGLLEIEFTAQRFQEIFQAENENHQETMMLTDGNGRILYTENQEDIGSNLELEVKEGRDYVVTYPLGHFQWNLAGVLDSDAVTRELSDIIPLLAGVFLAIMLLVMVIAVTIFRSFLHPLNQLIYGMERVQDGDLDVAIERKRQDEFGVLADNFNDMVVRIRELLSAVRQQRNNYYRLEMLALKSKLNPHFLYNAFDLIYWKLILKNDYETADVVVTLADILRYCVNHKKEYVTVREDMQYMDSYLSFQNLLMNGKLDYLIDIPEELKNYEMPKLLLQPLVENAIKYGSGKEGGVLRLKLEREGNYLLFSVQDEGSGIPEEICEKMMKDSEDKGGFGIRLVKAMVRSTYGEDCGIAIHSRKGEGTLIQVKIRDRIPMIPPK